jgi:hypothetical protein
VNGVAYSLPELFLIKRRFTEGLTDLEISKQLARYFGRKCESEAIRKVRRTLGLKKVPTYQRWEWKPDVTAAGGLDELAASRRVGGFSTSWRLLDELAASRRDSRRHIPCKYVTLAGKRKRVYLVEEKAA